MSKNAIRFSADAIASGRIGTARIHSEIASAAARMESNDMPALERPIAKMVEKSVKRPKYGNRKCVVDGITFDSVREGARYTRLAAMRAAGEITDLRIQVPFVVVPSAVVGGRKRPARKYVADFVYVDAAGETVVEDVKGMRTAMYSIKRQLMKAVHGIEIREV